MKYSFGIGWLAVLMGILTFFCSSGDTGGEHGPPELLEPADFTYLGAFRMPDGIPGIEVKSWAWGGYAMTYYPDGDPSGPDDGYPGSIFAGGHSWEYQISEVSIPIPVRSSSKNLDELNTAITLQPFYDIVDVRSLEIPRVGLAYLPRQGEQSRDKIYFCWGSHFQQPDDLTHGWCELDLSRPETQRGWYLDCPHNVYNTNDYLFEIPENWSNLNCPGKRLATGRFRDGGWSGQGPALFAIGPWNQGNPPPYFTSLDYITLLRYTSADDYDEIQHTMNDYHHSDEWSGGIWITSGHRSAVVFVGTKGKGDCWYGDQNGPCLECEGERGWWSSEFSGQFIFYDPGDLSRVATGEMQPWEPQPYDSLEVDANLYGISSQQQKYHLGAACYDRLRHLLYVFEPRADGDKPIVHVWQIVPE